MLSVWLFVGLFLLWPFCGLPVIPQIFEGLLHQNMIIVCTNLAHVYSPSRIDAVCKGGSTVGEKNNDGAVRNDGFNFEANKIFDTSCHESDANIWFLRSLIPTAIVTSRINILLLWKETLTVIFVWQPNFFQKKPTKNRIKVLHGGSEINCRYLT